MTPRKSAFPRSDRRARNIRLRFALVVGAVFGAVVVLSIPALDDSVVYYRTPTELLKQDDTGQRMRVGGMVEPDTVVERDGILMFTLTDGATRINVRYRGSAPGVFQAGQDALVEGTLSSTGVFDGEHIMVKHAESYRAPAAGNDSSAPGEGGR